MKKDLFSWVFALLMMPFVNAGCQNDNKVAPSANYDIEVPESLVKFAEQMGFKYNEVLARAKKGENKAIKEFLDFHGTADGMDGINHAVATLELITVAGDERVAAACRRANPKLNVLLIERFTQAQGRTKKEELRQPMKDWAPMTWAAINNIPKTGSDTTGTGGSLKGEGGVEKSIQGGATKKTDAPADGATVPKSDGSRQ